MHIIKRIALFIFILFMPIYLSAQTDDLDKLMTKRALDCRDVADRCWTLIPEYFEQEKMDSAQLLLAYWERKCGMNEEIYQAKFLFSILNRTFDEKQLTGDIFNEIYQRNSQKQYRVFNKSYYSHVRFYKPDTAFSHFITALANRAYSKSLTKTEVFLIKSYVDSTKNKLNELENEAYNNTVLQSLYKQFKKRIFDESEAHVGLYTGYFNPLGKNKLLGNKGILGAYLGYKFGKNQIDLLADVKIGGSKEKYLALNQGKLMQTQEYGGFYVGVEYSRALITTYKSDFSILTGLGGERIATAFEDKANNIANNFLWSPTFNSGFGFKHNYIRKNGFWEYVPYWGLQARFNYLNFVNTGGTDIRGNAFSIRFIWGLADNPSKRRLYDN
jgi:hypothetical protein